MYLRVFIPTFISLVLFQFCKKPNEVAPKDMISGVWKVDTAIIEEYLDDSLIFRYVRLIDSSRIELYPDNVYKSFDPDLVLYFFTSEGWDKATNQVEGGVWASEQNYSVIRLDKNVPEFNGRTPSVLTVEKLSATELNFTYDYDPWIFVKDINKTDLTGRNFIIPPAQKDGGGRLMTDTSYSAGYNLGYKITYAIGFYQGNIQPYQTTYFWYHYLVDGYWNLYISGSPYYNHFNRGYMDGRAAGHVQGISAGKKFRSLKEAHKTYKFIYKTRKVGDL